MASLYFKYAAMNSGKSTQLIQVHYNYIERNMSPIAMTADLDNRYSQGKITARIGVDLDVECFNKETDIFKFIKDKKKHEAVDALLIDEAQFLSEDQVLQCARLVDEAGIPVICYGLKTDFLSNLFSGSEALLRLADNIEEIKTICWCGRKATQTARIKKDGTMVRSGSQIEIGGNDMYTVLCRKHFMSGEARAILAVSEDGDRARA